MGVRRVCSGTRPQVPEVASQGETLLLTLFSFCGESGTTVSSLYNWTHLSGRFRDWESRFRIAC